MPTVLALFAHPDDIEFHASGTLLQLARQGWELHYCCLSSGNLGSTDMPPAQTVKVRRLESKAAAQLLGATWHPPICNDLQIFYTDRNIRRICALMRLIRPSILLTHPLQDYMEDHSTTCRLAVSAAFARGIPHYRSSPHRAPALDPITLYHSMPRGLVGPDRHRPEPEAFVDVAPVQELRQKALACHRSQQQWLDVTQGPGSFLGMLESESLTLGRRSSRFIHAEAWSRHLHIGFCAESDDPLRLALGSAWSANPRFTV
jgi:LmbE family N-acetylglucosaminyl deacetylase